MSNEHIREIPPTREICHECKEINPIGFNVPNWLWSQVVGDERILCLRCFVHRADDAFAEWDKHIEFWPVSKKSHRETIQATYDDPSETEQLRQELQREQEAREEAEKQEKKQRHRANNLVEQNINAENSARHYKQRAEQAEAAKHDLGLDFTRLQEERDHYKQQVEAMKPVVEAAQRAVQYMKANGTTRASAVDLWDAVGKYESNITPPQPETRVRYWTNDDCVWRFDPIIGKVEGRLIEKDSWVYPSGLDTEWLDRGGPNGDIREITESEAYRKLGWGEQAAGEPAACPWCECDVHYLCDEYEGRMVCKRANCRASGPRRTYKNEAIAAWNRIAQHPHPLSARSTTMRRMNIC